MDTPDAPVLGIDIGGTGMKGAPVDLRTGDLIEKRYRMRTPQPATPHAVADLVATIVEHFGWSSPIGCTFPAIIKDGIARSAANVDDSWIGTDGDALFEERTGCPVTLVNDADAAGIAEIAFGAGRNRAGVVLVVTLGTGIGTALFNDGVLVPNTEFGHVQLDGHGDVEDWAAARVREAAGLSWAEYGVRVNRYLEHMNLLLSPDLVILGGGASKQFAEFEAALTVPIDVVPAALRNNAGIVGAALRAG